MKRREIIAGAGLLAVVGAQAKATQEEPGHDFDSLNAMLEAAPSLAVGDIVTVADFGRYEVVGGEAEVYDLAAIKSPEKRFKAFLSSPSFYNVGLWWKGGSDITEALEDACSKVISKTERYFADFGHDEPFELRCVAPITLPPGRYTYSGDGIDLQLAQISLSCEPGSTRIDIEKDIDLFRISGKPTTVHCRGLGFSGGRSVFNFSERAEMTGASLLFENNTFYDYCGAAIANASIDSPHLYVIGNKFEGRRNPGQPTFGLAWGGYVTNACILRNKFFRNVYNILLDGSDHGLDGTFNIEMNDFVSYGEVDMEADIWLAPGSGQFGRNAGQGGRIIGNKFGSENYRGWPRILVATPQAGVRGASGHSPTFQPQDGLVISGITISQNRFSGSGNATPPNSIVKSYISDLRSWTFAGDNVVDGVMPDRIVDFQGEAAPMAGDCIWDYSPPVAAGSHAAFSGELSNSSIGFNVVGSHGGTLNGLSHSGAGGGSTAAGTVMLLHGIGAFLVGTPKEVQLQDPERPGSIVLRCDGQRSVSARIAPWFGSAAAAWFDAELGGLLSNGGASVLITVREEKTGRVALQAEVKPDSVSRFCRLPFVLPRSSANDEWTIRLLVNCADPSGQGMAWLSRPALYLSNAPVQAWDLRTFGDGTRDGGHLVLGESHLWVSVNGAIEFSHAGGAPNAVGVRVDPPERNDSVGAPGQWACNQRYMFIYAGNGAAHRWRRVPLEDW